MGALTYARVRSGETGAILDECVRRSDGVLIPNDPDNHDWQDYAAWCAAGNVPGLPPPLPVVPPAATPYQITLALNLQGSGAAAGFDAAVAKAKPSDRIRWNARTEPIPADNPVFVRLCGLAGLDPVPLHAAAVKQ